MEAKSKLESDPFSHDLTTETRKLGRYELCYELASGGMAKVYLARAEGPAGFEKLVALKRIHRHLAAEKQFVEMFLDEARLASLISHPNVCSVFDFGQADGTYFIAMEYVVGETLDRVWRRLSKDPTRLLAPETAGIVARIVADACEGLHAAHELRGENGQLLHVVHRDVSPQNLFVAYDGTVRVVDFGIARSSGRLHETRTGTIKGKLAYMSPEQGRKLPVDRRADIWALGVILWELLCGKRLFSRETDLETIMAVLTDEIPRPSKMRPSISPKLDDIVDKALSRDREQRYTTARALGRDLHRYIASLAEPVTASDVADFMAGLFGEERAQKLELIDAARRGLCGTIPARTSTPPAPVPDADPDTESDTETDPHERRAAAAAPPAVALPDVAREAGHRTSVPALASPVPGRAGERSSAGGRAWLGATIGIGVAIGIGAAIFSAGDEPANDEPVGLDGPRPVEGTHEVAPATEPRVAEAEAARPTIVAPAATSAEAPVVAQTPPPPVAPPRRPRPRRARTARTSSTARVVSAEPTPAVPAPTPPPPPPGHVNVACPGAWADVLLGGRRLGRVPGRIAAPAGHQTLTFMPFGRGPAVTREVDVPSAGDARLVVRFGN